ncbi:MAG: tetratricopeptide repeat protein [Candidatus Sumerlaeia bacterium]|nr:tetratricopeptide repeat protein [Candidatus Sumerlaeia bacterium]
MVPPEWEDSDEWNEDLEESEYNETYGGDPLHDDEEDDEEDYFEDDFVETPSEDDESELDDLIAEGEALLEEGEYHQAIQLFTDAAERFNDDPTAIFHVGYAYMLLFSEMVENDDHWQVNDELVTYRDEAENAFETALSLDEEFYPAMNAYGALFACTGNFREAVSYWERSLDLYDDQPEIAEAVQEARSRF